MRTKIKIVAICLGYFVILSIILSAIAAWIIYTDPNRELIVDKLKSIIRPTVYLDCEIKCEEIKEMHILTPVILPNADKVEPIGNEGDHIYTYTNPQNIKKIMDYMCKIKLTKAEKSELANITPNTTVSEITLYLKNELRISFTIVCDHYFIIYYDYDFIRDKQVEKIDKDCKLYRSRKGNIIEGIKKLHLVESDDRDN